MFFFFKRKNGTKIVIYFVILFFAIFSSFLLTSYREGIEDMGTSLTNHNVNLPINTSYECTNFCNPLNLCSLTGEQCVSDIDCLGCQRKYITKSKTADIQGDSDAGKLTYTQTPVYSILTTDIGTHATLYNNLETPPIDYDKGLNVWRSSYNFGNSLFQQKYFPSNIKGSMTFQPVYPKRYSLSGEFVDDGPLAANASL